MTSAKPLLAAAALSLLAATAAYSSDLPPIINAPEVTIGGTSIAQGWYIRGDLGYSGWVRGGKPTYTDYAVNGGDPVATTFDGGRFSEPFSYGVGMGYQFNDVFRADLTTDFFNGSFDGRSNLGAPCTTSQAAGTTCGVTHNADYNAISVLANGYVDIANIAGFTPYVGAGVGMTNIQWGGSHTYRCKNGAGVCDGTTYLPENWPGEESWRFTYALMAGASYDLTNRVKLDLGYRFTDMNGGKMFGYTTAEQANGATGTKAFDDGFQRHEFRAGIRINTW